MLAVCTPHQVWCELAVLLVLLLVIGAAAWWLYLTVKKTSGNTGETGHGLLYAVKLYVPRFEVNPEPIYEVRIKSPRGIIRSTHVPQWLLDEHVLTGPLHLTRKSINLRASRAERQHAAYKVATSGYVFHLDRPLDVEWNCDAPGRVAWRLMCMRVSPVE